MLMQNWGEERFVEYMRTQFPAGNARVGIGDDCAVIPNESELFSLVTTDALVEGIHFIKGQIPPTDLGYKAIAVNVSDILAMGGIPKCAFLSIALPSTTDCVWLKSVIQGVKEACTKWEIELLGGDTVGSKRDLFFNVTLIGSAPHDRIKYRHGAKAGDSICVSNYLGNSGGGLKALQESTEQTAEVLSLIRSHFRPDPSVAEGVFLSLQKGVRAMIDLSDGLDCDLSRLIQASRCGAVIDIPSLPLSKELMHVSKEQKWDASNLAITAGEDYCLLLTVSADTCDAVQCQFLEKFGHPLYKIGQITEGPQQILYQAQGKPVALSLQRYNPFA